MKPVAQTPSPPDAAARKAATPKATPRTAADILADFVTPGDLLKSPSLTLVGTLRL